MNMYTTLTSVYKASCKTRKDRTLIENKSKEGRAGRWQKFPSLLAIIFFSMLAVFGCETSTKTVRILAYDVASDSYKLSDVELETIENMSRLEGEATVLKGGLSIEIDYVKEQLDWKEEGHAVSFSAIEKDGVLIPETYDSLAMVSIYHNMEHATLFFNDELGLGPPLLKRLPTYYQPKVVLKDHSGEETMIDSAFYLKIEDGTRGFFILPFDVFQWLPMALNTGIIVHEYTHYVFDRLVLDSIYLLDDAGHNFLRSVNEGVADYYAAVSMGDPAYISHSVPEGLFETSLCNATRNMELSRDISNPQNRNYNQAMDRIPRSSFVSALDYCPYEIGLFFAALLYEIAGELSGTPFAPSRSAQMKVARWLRDSLIALGTQMPSRTTFELWELFSLIVQQANDPHDRATVCAVLEQRYSLYFSEVQGC